MRGGRRNDTFSGWLSSMWWHGSMWHDFLTVIIFSELRKCVFIRLFQVVRSIRASSPGPCSVNKHMHGHLWYRIVFIPKSSLVQSELRLILMFESQFGVRVLLSVWAEQPGSCSVKSERSGCWRVKLGSVLVSGGESAEIFSILQHTWGTHLSEFSCLESLSLSLAG